MQENDEKQKKELNSSTLLLWMIISGGGVGGVTGFFSGGTSLAIDDHADIKADQSEMWRDIRSNKGQIEELRARINYITQRNLTISEFGKK